MSHGRAVGWFLVVVGMVALLVGCGSGAGTGLVIEEVWARPAMAGGQAMAAGGGMAAAGTGALFMRISNESGETDRLMGGSTAVATVVEIHETVMAGEVMRMQMLPQGLEIPAGGEVMLKPGGYHVMLIGMQRDLKVGDTFDVELLFEKAGPRVVTVEVKEM